MNQVYIESGTSIQDEYYLSLLVDRTKESWTYIASREGGVDIEAVAEDSPEKIINYTIDPSKGLDLASLHKVAAQMGFQDDVASQFISITQKMFEIAKGKDANLIEVNPLILNDNNQLIALDAKISIESNALFRQEELLSFKDDSQENELEVKASEHDLSYVSLDGNIACMVNGAGLAMATMDLIKLHGGSLEIFSQKGLGTTATVIFPARRVSESRGTHAADESSQGMQKLTESEAKIIEHDRRSHQDRRTIEDRRASDADYMSDDKDSASDQAGKSTDSLQ